MPAFSSSRLHLSKCLSSVKFSTAFSQITDARSGNKYELKLFASVNECESVITLDDYSANDRAILNENNGDTTLFDIVDLSNEAARGSPIPDRLEATEGIG